MRALRASTALSALAAAAVLLAGCSGSEESGKEGTGSAEQPSPLAKYYDAVYGGGGDLSPEEQEQRFAEEQRQTEELAATCMQEEGFEYEPNPQTGGFSADGGEWEPDDREWVAQYGYGAVTSPFSEQPPPEEEYVDVNADYVSSLSESEQQAYYEALYGVQPTEDQLSEDGSYEYDWRTAGCMGAAQHEVAGEDLSQSEEFKPLFDAMNELYESTMTSPDMVALDGEWSSCMDAAGHGGFVTQADAQNSVYEEMNAFYESGGDGSGTEPVEPVEPDQAALDALGEKEVELALADLDCREETDYRDRAAEITREAEEQFVADNQSELDALLAAAEQD